MKRGILGPVAIAIAFNFGLAGCATTSKGPSDRDLLEALQVRMVAAVDAQDIEGLLDGFADSFYNGQVGDKKGLREFLRNADTLEYLDGLELVMDNAVIVVDGNKALIDPVGLNGSFGWVTLTMYLQKIDGRWLVTEMDVQT